MTAENIISAIGLVGLGGLINSWFNYFIDNRKRKSEAKHQFKEARYKAITLLCYALINYDVQKHKLLSLRPDIQSEEDLLDEIKTEWINTALYASDKVIFSLKTFVEYSTETNFNKIILAMRKDLFDIKTNIQSNDFVLNRHISITNLKEDKNGR